MSNNKTVWVVYSDKRKNMSAAEQYGTLKDIFSSVGRAYNGDAMIDHARRVLDDWNDGDSLLMVGDPTLCAICLSVALEKTGIVQVLRWDNIMFKYTPIILDFQYEGV